MNAAAMPGGKVVVFTGLKQCVTTEEDLAAVLAHEISHVLLRHSAEQMASQAAMSYFFIFLALLGLPVNELTLLLGDLTVSKPNSRLHEKVKKALPSTPLQCSFIQTAPNSPPSTHRKQTPWASSFVPGQATTPPQPSKCLKEWLKSRPR